MSARQQGGICLPLISLEVDRSKGSGSGEVIRFGEMI